MSRTKKHLVVLLAVVMVLCMVPAMAFGASDDGQDNVIAGQNRYETAALIAKDAFPGGANTVIIANGEEARGYADALAGSFLAGAAKAPILLTYAGTLPAETEDAIEKLNPTEAYVLGGELAISEDVCDELEGLGLEVERVAGGNRFETAKAVFDKGAELLGDAPKTALIANGSKPADALVAGAYAYANNIPVLLVDKDSIPAATTTALAGMTKTYVIGGNLVVSDNVLRDLPNATRVAGQTQYATSVAVAEKLWKSPKDFALVKGVDGVVDALAGCVLGVPILYVDATTIPVVVDEYLDEVIAEDSAWYVLGGRVKEDVNNAVQDKIDALIEELKVVSVSAINANYVVVKITAPEEDLLAQVVEVKNSDGVVVPVKPLDIAAGDDVAEFEFVTPVKEADLKGVWTVNGVEYDLDLFNNLKAFLEAENQLALNKAFTDLGIKNVKVANMPAYFEAKGELDKTALELTVADVQKLVDDVNAKFVSAEDEKAIVKAVVDALGGDEVNQVALLQALQNDAFVRVNPDWVAVPGGYADALKAADPAITKDSKIKDIQTVINNVNDALIKAELENLKTNGDYTELDKVKLTKVKNLIETYATVDDKGVITDSTIKNAVEGKVIEIQLALADVVAATTPTSLKNRVVALNELLAKDAKIDMEKEYIDANAKLYIKQIAEAEAEDKVNTVTKLKTAISNVNAEVNKRLSIETFSVTYDTAYSSKAKGDVRLLGYWVEVNVGSENTGYKVGDTESIVIELYKGDKLLGKQSFKNYGDEEKTAASIIGGTIDVYGEYVSTSWDHEWYGKITDIPDKAVAKVKYKKDGAVAVNEKPGNLEDTFKTAAAAIYLADINEAETVAEVKAALDALADLGEVEGYLSIRSVDRDFVAAYVLKERPATDGYTNLDAVEGEVTDAVTAHGKALTAINGLTYASTPAEVVEALELILDEDFGALSNNEKTLKAEAFHDKLVFNDEGKLKTPFRTLAEVKALLWQ